MLKPVTGPAKDARRTLLIDTCGATGSVALAEGATVLAVRSLEARSASRELLGVMEEMLATQRWAVRELNGIGVVSGPGSFTGVRVGMAAAKGLCCGLDAPLAAVSRLEVLTEAAGVTRVVAVLDAGRGEFYVRTGSDGREMLCGLEALRSVAAGQRVVVAEPAMMQALEDLQPELYEMGAGAALPAALRVFAGGGSDLAEADANYVRGERDIYAKVGERA